MSLERQVFIADDDDSVREAMIWLLDSVGLKSVGFPNGRAFLDSVDPQARGCAILDLRMPGMGGLDVQAALQKRGSTLPVIIVTGHGDVPATVRAMKAGAVDFIQKPFNNQLFIDTVLHALALQDNDANKTDDVAISNLTPREQQVLSLLVSGNTNKEVAVKLGLSVKTAEYHRANIMKKTGATTLSNLVSRTATVTLRDT